MRAYPNLSCTGKPEFMYCAGNDSNGIICVFPAGLDT
jgi:hypothetical protein